MSVIRPGGISGVIRPVAGAAFSPDSLAGLILWLDAGVGTYSDTGLTTPQTTDAGAVAGWSSRTGTNPVTQATGADQPTLRTNVVNGKSILRFDGAGDRLLSAALGASEAQPNTLFAVAKKATNDIAASHVLNGRMNTTSNTNLIGTNGAGNYRINAGSSIAISAVETNWNILAGLINGGSSKVWVNGGVGTTGNAGTQALTGFTIGAAADGASSFDGDIAEALVYSAGLTEAEINSVIAYLGTKYAITVTTVS